MTLSSLAGASETGTLVLSGVKGELRQNVESQLALASEPCDAPAWRVKRRFQRVDEQVGEALRALGYYRPRVEKSLQWKDGCWQADVTVNPGEPVRVTSRDLVLQGEARQDAAFSQLLAELPLKPGAPMHHGAYETLKSQLQDLASERGYFSARFLDRSLRVNPVEGKADIRLVFDSGPRFRIGEIRIDEHPYGDQVVRQLLTLESGQPYDSTRLQESYRNLADSGYFERVEVQPELGLLADQAVPVHIGLVARKRHAYRFSLGASSDTGVRLGAEYENRRINNRGHQLKVSTALSPVLSDLNLEYAVPLYNSRWERFGLQGGFTHEDTDTALSDRLGVSAKLQRHRGAWLETWFVELQQEQSTLEGRDLDSTLLMPGVSWNRNRVDDVIRPRSGERYSLELRGAWDGLLSDASLLQVRAKARLLRPLGRGLFIGRAELGTTMTSDFDALPASLRFFAGGDQSVRGYDYESLAPVDGSGKVSGGHHLLAASLEYEYPVARDWGVAAFVDTGNAFDSYDDGLKTGVGLGLRWYSPVGPVRVDLAVPLDDSPDSFRIHFSFGAGL